MYRATSFSGTSGTQENLVTVRVFDVQATQRFATTDEFVAAALNKIDSGVFQGGLSVSMEEFGREVDLSEDHQNVIHRDWQPAASTLNRELFIVGYAVVRPVPHPKYAGEWLPYIVPWNKYELQFIETSQLPRRYFVAYNDVTYPAATVAELLDRPAESQETPAKPPKRTKTLASPIITFDPSILRLQANENNIGYPMSGGGRAHLIFVRYAPTVEGYLQSPVALLRRSMTGLRQMFDDEGYSSYWRAHPLHVVAISKNYFGNGGAGGGTTGRETFGQGKFAEADIKDDSDRYRFDHNQAEYLDFQMAARAAEEGRGLTLRDKESLRKNLYALASATHRTEPENPNAAMAPSDFHNIVLGANQVMTQGPKPEGTPNLEKIRDMVMDTAFSILNIIPQVMNPQRTKQAGADPATVLREWDSALQAIQQNLGPMLVEIYQVAYAQRDADFVNGIYKLFKSEAERLEDEAEATYDPTSTNGILTRRQFESMLERNGQQDLISVLRTERKRTAKQEISGNIRVKFSFNHVPKNTLQDLRMLYDIVVISEDTFVRMAGRMLGIAMEDILLDETDREKERKKRRKEQEATLESELQLKAKYLPEKDSTGGAGFGKGLAAGSGGSGLERNK